MRILALITLALLFPLARALEGQSVGCGPNDEHAAYARLVALAYAERSLFAEERQAWGIPQGLDSTSIVRVTSDSVCNAVFQAWRAARPNVTISADAEIRVVTFAGFLVGYLHPVGSTPARDRAYVVVLSPSMTVLSITVPS